MVMMKGLSYYRPRHNSLLEFDTSTHGIVSTQPLRHINASLYVNSEFFMSFLVDREHLWRELRYHGFNHFLDAHVPEGEEVITK